MRGLNTAETWRLKWSRGLINSFEAYPFACALAPQSIYRKTWPPHRKGLRSRKNFFRLQIIWLENTQQKIRHKWTPNLELGTGNSKFSTKYPTCLRNLSSHRGRDDALWLSRSYVLPTLLKDRDLNKRGSRNLSKAWAGMTRVEKNIFVGVPNITRALLPVPSAQKLQKQARWNCSWMTKTQYSELLRLRFSACGVFILAKLSGERILSLKVIPLYMILPDTELMTNANFSQIYHTEKIQWGKNNVNSVLVSYPQQVHKCNPSDELCCPLPSEPCIPAGSTSVLLSICSSASSSQFPYSLVASETFVTKISMWTLRHGDVEGETQASLFSHSSSVISPPVVFSTGTSKAAPLPLSESPPLAVTHGERVPAVAWETLGKSCSGPSVL